MAPPLLTCRFASTANCTVLPCSVDIFLCYSCQIYIVEPIKMLRTHPPRGSAPVLNMCLNRIFHYELNAMLAWLLQTVYMPTGSSVSHQKDRCRFTCIAITIQMIPTHLSQSIRFELPWNTALTLELQHPHWTSWSIWKSKSSTR